MYKGVAPSETWHTEGKTPSVTWQVEHLRLTAFPTKPLIVDAAKDWWQQMAGRESEKSSTDKRAGLYVEEGPIEDEGGSGAFLELQTQVLRINWRLHAIETAIESGWPTIGAFRDRQAQFLALINPWLQSLYDQGVEIKRIALGAVLLEPVANHAEGCKHLSGLLPFELDPSATDFQYQINRRRESKTLEGLHMNRLSKWSVARLQSLQFELNAGEKQAAVETVDTIHAARLELDVNTAQEWTESLPSDTLAPLADELAALAVEISEIGDKP